MLCRRNGTAASRAARIAASIPSCDNDASGPASRPLLRPYRSRPAMIIDCHGHYTTEPPALHAFRKAQLAGDASARAAVAVKVSDDELRATVKDAQLRIQHERGTDLTIF